MDQPVEFPAFGAEAVHVTLVGLERVHDLAAHRLAEERHVGRVAIAGVVGRFEIRDLLEYSRSRTGEA